jgi:predicted nucleic acid-binding Zn ribbon protein
MFWNPSDAREISGNQQLTDEQCKEIIQKSLTDKKIFDLIVKLIKENTPK